MSTTDESATNGRSVNGTFSKGNQFSKGVKHSQHIAKLRRAFTSALTESDILNLVTTLLKLAMEGDTTAARLILDRALGRVAPPDADNVADAELDAAEELRAAIAKVREMNPDCSQDFIESKAELLIRLESLTDEQQRSVAASMKARKEARQAELVQ